MSKSLPSIDTNTDTFFSWIVKTNGLVTFANTEVVTANNSANGATTTGKGYVIGTFGANTLVCDTLAGGNTVATANLAISTNATFNGTFLKITPGATLGANSSVHEQGIKSTTSGLTQQAVDTFAIATYRSAKYVLSIKDNATSSFQTTEIMLLQDGTNTITTEYATLVSNSSLGTFSSDILTGNARLLFTPTVAATTIHIHRVLLSAA